MLEEKYSQEEGAAGVEPQGARARLRLRRSSTSTARCRSASRRWTPTSEQILIDGNTATALGCVYAGATVAAWYPITPSTSVMDAFKQFCAATTARTRETGKNNYCILQAEDELAAIGMVIGASWNGARAFTSTSGPGISLMSELIGLAYYAEIPAVIVDVQRTGPSTGMPTRTQQGDILACAYASHGDTKHILLFPANPDECFYFAGQAFDLAERFQTPVFMLSDLDIGMNDWVCPQPQVGRRLPARPRRACSAPRSSRRCAKFYRYSHEDGDGVAARTLPGVHSEGRVLHARLGPQQVRRLHRDPRRVPGGRSTAWRASTRRAAKARARRPIIRKQPGATFGIVTVGGCDPAVREALDDARPSAASTPTTCACAASRSTRASRRSCARTSASTSSSRTATRSCARC